MKTVGLTFPKPTKKGEGKKEPEKGEGDKE